MLQLLCVENQPRKEIAEGLENSCIFCISYITPAPASCPGVAGSARLLQLDRASALLSGVRGKHSYRNAVNY